MIDGCGQNSIVLEANFFVMEKFGQSGSKQPAGDFWFFSSKEKNKILFGYHLYFVLKQSTQNSRSSNRFTKNLSFILKIWRFPQPLIISSRLSQLIFFTQIDLMTVWNTKAKKRSPNLTYVKFAIARRRATWRSHKPSTLAEC